MAKQVEEDKYDEGVEYWEKRYTNEPKPSDWILKPHQLTEVLNRFTAGRTDLRILQVGCGNSLLSEDMYDAGHKHQVNIDTSTVVINQMKARYADNRPEMEWLVVDATGTDFPEERFDLVIDKATLDTLLCEDDDDYSMVSSYLKEMDRVMSSKGVFLLVTFGPPQDRLHHFSRPPLNFVVETIEIPAPNTKVSSCFYVYACTKPTTGS